MQPTETAICALAALAAAGLAGYVAGVARQITYVTLADGRRRERRLPLLFRLVLPLTANLAPLFRGPALAQTRERIEKRLVAAGFDGVLAPAELMSLSVLLPILPGILWILFWRGLLGSSPNAMLRATGMLLCVSGPLWLLVYPELWLRRARAERHERIRRSLPFVLDLLTLSVEAGMDFMSAMQRNVQRRRLDALGEELVRVMREIQIGKTRRQALRDLSERVGLSELRSVVNALVQAEELGVSIGSILRIQADQMRQRRFERAEKKANEAPVKMLFPLVFFIFPSVFLILLGPVVARFLAQGF